MSVAELEFRVGSAAWSNPSASAIHPSRREATPVIFQVIPCFSSSSCARSSSSRTSVRLTFPKPRKHRLKLRMKISLNGVRRPEPGQATTDGLPPAQECFLSHSCGVLGLDLVEHAHLTRLRIRILIYAQIFLRHLINVPGSAVFGDLHHASTNLEIAI